MGLFHAKIAGIRCVANEHWGVANSKAPWSLWKVNMLLGRKAISCGWKASKQLPPYKLLAELVHIALVANILDGFRLYCGYKSIDEWVKSGVKEHVDVRKVSCRIFEELVSSRRVEKLRAGRSRDPVLENVVLFNRDALLFRTLQAAIKRGDIGTVVNILTFWMVMFRGTGKMPKYADILFSTLMGLKNMNPTLRYVFIFVFVH
jgi:hypothetical protein